MKVIFGGPTDVARSVNASDKRLLNYYAEVDQRSKDIISLYGTPGLSTRATCATSSVVRGMRAVGTSLYVASGTKLSVFTTSFAETNLGTLNTSSGPVYMRDNLNQLMAVDGADGYIVTISSAAFATVSSAGFPASPTGLAFIDQYFITADSGTDNFYISALGDGNSWDALDTAAAEGLPDDIVGIAEDHRELWLLGEKSGEVWANTGNPDFPFERLSGAFIETGCAAAASVVRADNSIFWLGADERGKGVVWRANGYTPARISSHAFEFAVQAMSTISDCVAWAQQEGGHIFVWFTFPTGQDTWVYDCATQLWHQRPYTRPADGVFLRHRANCYAFFNGLHIVGDHTNGKIYQMSQSFYDDAGDALTSLAGSEHIWDKDELKRLFHHRLQIDIEAGVGLVSGTGSDPQIQLRWSDDGGHTWGSWHYADIGSYAAIGAVGEYRRRALWQMLGSSRDRIYETQTTDPVKRVILGANARITKGTS